MKFKIKQQMIPVPDPPCLLIKSEEREGIAWEGDYRLYKLNNIVIMI